MIHIIFSLFCLTITTVSYFFTLYVSGVDNKLLKFFVFLQVGLLILQIVIQVILNNIPS